MNLECSSDMETRNCKIQLTVTTATGRIYKIEIGETPSFKSEYYSNPRKIKHTCKHIVWVLLNKFGIRSSNAILAQVSFTVSEINFIFNQQYNQNLSLVMQNQISTSQELKSKRHLKRKVRVLKNGMQINYWRGKRQSVASVPDHWMLRNCTYYQWSTYSSRSAFCQGTHFLLLRSNEMFGEKTIHE